MKMKTNTIIGDDLKLNRLFFYLRKKGIHVKHYYVNKPHVVFVVTTEGPKVLKRYQNPTVINRIFLFLHALSQSGYQQAINFEHYPNGGLYVKDENDIWSMMPYVPSIKRVSYKIKQHRKDVFTLLNKYHHYAQPFCKAHSDFFPKYSLIEVWTKRLSHFKENQHAIIACIGQDHYKQLCEWAEVALQLMNTYEHDVSANETTIIHGDVAAHNFIQNAWGQYFMIDFDQAAQSSSLIEYIQLAQRFLMYENYSLQHVKEEQLFEKQLTSPFFLSALLFPSMFLLQLYMNTDYLSYPAVRKLQIWTKKEVRKRRRLYKEIVSIIPNI
ncbi:phosphotransferase [Priestia megaterium]|nr:phosphotransferase [Priestia megaterium]